MRNRKDQTTYVIVYLFMSPTAIYPASAETITIAANHLRQGGLVAMPTETVYGLAANALDGQAVQAIFSCKGRPSHNPLIVHVSSLAMAEELAVFSDAAYALAHRFWPGALTLVLPVKSQAGLAKEVTAGLDTVALRMPAHAIAHQLIAQAGVPLAAPSANRSGNISPTCAAHVLREFPASELMIIDGGACRIGLESTVVMPQAQGVSILRPGSITAEDITRGCALPVVTEKDNVHLPRSPGQLLKHYAPSLPLRINAVEAQEGEAFIVFGSAPASLATLVIQLSEKGCVDEAAKRLYHALRTGDESGCRSIAVMPIPEVGIGRAINERLQKAATASGTMD